MTIGLIIPVVAYLVLRVLYELLETMGITSDIGFAEDFRTRTLMLIAICSNLIVMQTYRKSYHHETIRGMLVASMILVGSWFGVFGIKILRA